MSKEQAEYLVALVQRMAERDSTLPMERRAEVLAEVKQVVGFISKNETGPAYSNSIPGYNEAWRDLLDYLRPLQRQRSTPKREDSGRFKRASEPVRTSMEYVQRALYDYDCSDCGGLISKGSPYRRERWSYPYGPIIKRICVRCTAKD